MRCGQRDLPTSHETAHVHRQRAGARASRRSSTRSPPACRRPHPSQAELEFVQSLANTEYLHYLAQNRYLDDPAFVEYLDYLQYWREPRFCQYIVFPHCLRMLELLQQPSFRAALKRADFKDMVFRQQHDHWNHRLDAEPEERADGAGASEAGVDVVAAG